MVKQPSRWVPWGIASIALIFAIVFGIQWSRTSSELRSIRAQLAAQEAVANQKPDLKIAFDETFGSITYPTDAPIRNKPWLQLRYSATSDSADVTITSDNVEFAKQPLARLLASLGFSSAVQPRMSATRALDGTQRAEGKNVNVTWTYHPRDGLHLVFEVQ